MRMIASIVMVFMLVGVLPVGGSGELPDAVPTYKYSPDQQSVIKKYGNPYHFTILLMQQQRFRYESWFYFTPYKKQFGFVNGKKTLEKPLTFGMSAKDKVVGVTPNQFTFTTTQANVRTLFGTPTKTITGATGTNTVAWSYVPKGVTVTFANNKISGVATVPPAKKK